MTLEPAFVKDNPIMEAAYAAFVQWAFSNDDFRKQFEAESGMAPLSGRPIDIAIDSATGYSERYMRSFIAWVTTEHWGIEGDPRLDEAD